MEEGQRGRGQRVEGGVPRRVLRFVLRQATWRNILIVWGVLVVFNVVVLGPAYGRIEGFSGGAGAMDFLIVYRPEKAFDMVAAYGDQGRHYYATIALTLDTVFPILLALAFELALARIFRHAFSDEGVLHRALLVPVGAMVADLLENVGVVTMLLTYPRKLTAVALLTSSFSTVKWTAVAAQSILVLIGVIAWLINTRFRKTSDRSQNGEPDEG